MISENAVLQRLRRGEFNDIIQGHQADGTVILTLARSGEGKRYILHVRDLYGPDEEVLSEEIETR